MLQTYGEIRFNRSPPKNGEKPPEEQGADEAIKEEVKESLIDKTREGEREALKEYSKEEAKDRQKLEDLMDESKFPLFRFSSIFPFALFPTRVVIERDRIDISFQQFFSSSQIRSIVVKNITEVIIETGLITSNIRIVESRPGLENILDIKNIKKADALKAKRLIQGLIRIEQQEINTTKFTVEEILEKAEILGYVEEVEKD